MTKSIFLSWYGFAVSLTEQANKKVFPIGKSNSRLVRSRSALPELVRLQCLMRGYAHACISFRGAHALTEGAQRTTKQKQKQAPNKQKAMYLHMQFHSKFDNTQSVKAEVFIPRKRKIAMFERLNMV